MYCETCQKMLPRGETHCSTCNTTNVETQQINQIHEYTDSDKTHITATGAPTTPEIKEGASIYSAQNLFNSDAANTFNAKRETTILANGRADSELRSEDPPLTEEEVPQRPPLANVALKQPHQLPIAGPKKKPLGALLVLVGLVCLIILSILENTGVVYYITVAHPAEINKVTQSLNTIHRQTTDTVDQLQTANGFATISAKRLSLTDAQVKGDPALLYTIATTLPPVFDDALNDTATNNWPTNADDKESCGFQNNIYHITESQNSHYYYCNNRSIPSTSNFAFQAIVNIKGNDNSDSGGFLFRAQLDNTKYYYFDVSSDGYYNIDLFVDDNPDHIKILQVGQIPQFTKGLNQPNLLTVIALDAKIYIYANKQWVTTINDATYSDGDIALLASCNGQQPADVTFSNTKLWDLSH